MGKIGKISVIKKEYANSDLQTMEKSLYMAKNKLTRIPGAAVFKYPYKEIDGRYRTGLDPDAGYIKRIQDPTERELEKKRVKELRKKLEDALGDIKLDAKSTFWNYALSSSMEDPLHVQPAKLIDGDNIFDLSSPMQELTFSWLRVHPTIASSYQAWSNGEFPADTKFYVADDDMENDIAFKKKKSINKAISKFDAMSPERQRKIARLLGLPISDNTKEEFVYNQVDTLLKQVEFKDGTFKGLSTVEVFNRFADMKDNLLHIKDLVKQAISHSVYRVKPNGRIYEGEFEMSVDENELVKRLADEENQEELLLLEKKLKGKKLAAI
jgi:hypothetical protein